MRHISKSMCNKHPLAPLRPLGQPTVPEREHPARRRIGRLGRHVPRPTDAARRVRLASRGGICGRRGGSVCGGCDGVSVRVLRSTIYEVRFTKYDLRGTTCEVQNGWGNLLLSCNFRGISNGCLAACCRKRWITFQNFLDSNPCCQIIQNDEYRDAGAFNDGLPVADCQGQR